MLHTCAFGLACPSTRANRLHARCSPGLSSSKLSTKMSSRTPLVVRSLFDNPTSPTKQEQGTGPMSQAAASLASLSLAGLPMTSSSTAMPSSPSYKPSSSLASPTAVGGAHHHLQHSITGIPGVDGATLPLISPALVVFSGGTAFNSVAGHLRSLTTRVTHVLPVSDDGGSTAEVVRVLGGPAVGDIRSRCLRLADSSDTEACAVKSLLAHRLPAGDPIAAKSEWYSVVEGEHPLWEGVSEPYKHVIRAFLVHFQHQILAHASERFNFSNGSIGNFFFAGARTFFRSLEAAVFLFSRVARIPEGCTVLPAICTEERIILGAELEDGSVIRGQNNISHPPDNGGHVSEVKKNTSGQAMLPSPIRRVFYLSSSTHMGGGQAGTTGLTSGGVYVEPMSPGLSAGGSAALLPHPGLSGGVELEVLPSAHPTALLEVGRADAIIYGIGSLYTSICPTICLEGMGETVAARHVHKVLLLNGSHDRETCLCGAHEGPMTAADMVQAVCDALNRRRNRQGSRLFHSPSVYVTALLVPQGGEVEVDRQVLQLLGVRYVLEVRSKHEASGSVVYDPEDLVAKIADVLRLPLPLLPSHQHQHSTDTSSTN